MDPLYINGRYTTTDEKVVGVEDRGFQFGDGVYEVLKFLGKRPLFLEAHYSRLRSGLRELKIPEPWDRAGFESVCNELLRRTTLNEGILYFQVTRGECERTPFFQPGMTPTALGYPRRMSFPDAAKKSSGMRVITTEDLRWGRCDIKSTNLLASVLAKAEAREKGADEAILIAGGVVREGANSSFFGIRRSSGQTPNLVTHPLDHHILPGTVRGEVLRLAASVGILAGRTSLKVEELEHLEEAFLTSSTQAVMPIVAIDGAAVGNGRRGPVTLHLQELFDHLERQLAGPH